MEQMVIRINLAQLGFSYHTIYAGPGFRLTYINLHSDPPKCEPVYATQEYSTPPSYVICDVSVRWVHAALAISHSQCAVVFSHSGIAKVLGLPEYVASTTKFWTSKPTKVRASINIGGALHWDSILDASHPPNLNLNISILMVFSWAISRAGKPKVKPISHERWNHHSTSTEV